MDVCAGQGLIVLVYSALCLIVVGPALRQMKRLQVLDVPDLMAIPLGPFAWMVAMYIRQEDYAITVTEWNLLVELGVVMVITATALYWRVARVERSAGKANPMPYLAVTCAAVGAVVLRALVPPIIQKML